MNPIDVLAGLVLAVGQPWGLAAASWQLRDAAALLDDDGPRSHFWTRPRGGSKTTDVAGVLLAMLITGRLRGDGHVWAVDRDQAALVLGAARELVERTPSVRGLVEFSASSMSSTRYSGRVLVQAADAGGSYGLRSEFLVVDEAAQWPDTATHRTVLEAVLSTRQKVPGCRLLVVTSAGSPDHHSFGLLEHARSSPEWRTSEVPGPLPWVRPEDLADQERLLPASRYRQLHLNEWTSGEDQLASWEDLRACVRRSAPTLRPDRRVSRFSVGLDVGVKNDATVIAVMHRSDDSGLWSGAPLGEADRIDQALAAERGLPWVREAPAASASVFVLDELRVWEPSRLRPVDLAEVEAALLDVADRYGRAKVTVRFDPWQAQYLAERLARRDVSMSEFTFSASSVSRLALPLMSAIRERRLDLFEDDELLSELAGVELRESSPGVYRLDHARGKHDDRAVAIALAMSNLIESPPTHAWPTRYIDHRLIGRR